MKEDSEEGKKLRYDADHLLAQIAEGQEYAVRVTQAFYLAVGLEDRIRVTLRRNGHDLNCPCCNQTLDIPTPRQQKEMGTCLALCDYVNHCVGAFACTVSEKFVQRLETLKQSQGAKTKGRKPMGWHSSCCGLSFFARPEDHFPLGTDD